MADTYSNRQHAITVPLLILLSMFLGFLRDSLTAYFFGADARTDAYYVAALVPDMFASWVSYAIGNAVVPILKRCNLYSSSRAGLLAFQLLVYGGAVLLTLSIACFFLRGSVIHILAPSMDNGGSAKAAELLAIMTPGVLLAGMAGILWGVNNAYDQHVYPAIGNVVLNLVFILSMIAFIPVAGVDALGLSFVAGYLARLVVGWRPVWRVLRFGSLTRPSAEAVAVIRSLPAFFMGIAVSQVYTIVDRALASTLPPGQITVLNYVTKIGTLPASFFRMSIATVIFTSMVGLFASGNKRALRAQLERALAIATVFGTASGCIFITYSPDILTILYGHGAFDAKDVSMAVKPLRVYGLFCIAYLAIPVMINFFYAIQNNKTVTRLSLVSVGINICLSVWLVRPLGITGLVLANGLAQFIFVLSLLRRAAHAVGSNSYPFISGVCRLAYRTVTIVIAATVGGAVAVSRVKWASIGLAQFGVGMLFSVCIIVLYAAARRDDPVIRMLIGAISGIRRRTAKIKGT